MAKYGSEKQPRPLSAEARVARRFLALRRQRTVFFGNKLIDECDWEMMLDALVAHEEGRRNTLSNMCLATMAPPATAFRHLTKLIECEVMVRHPDPEDGRRVWVELTPEVESRMRILLQHWSLEDAAEFSVPFRRCACGGR